MSTPSRRRRSHFAPRPARAPDDQLDLVLWDAIAGELPLRDERDSMQAPLVSISKRHRIKPIEWESPRGERVIVKANPDFGMATIWDWDVIIYAVSQLNEKIERGENPGPRFRFHPHDCLRVLGRSTGKAHYQLLDDAIQRLYHTTVTILRPGEKNAERGLAMRLIHEVEWEKDESGRLLWIEAQLPERLYKAVKSHRSVLALSRDYFSLTGGLERALYRIARKMAGRASWRLTFDYLRQVVGSEREPRKFAFDLRKIIARNDLPDYRLEEETGAGGPLIVMIHRDVDNLVDNLVKK